ncbi:hypothetical protein BSKO_02146 [Bryopsis sp. KO-2023]|nr:hypothetical protein BSKO_02146 [Bryopsis sp. KO-2023]
MPAVSLSHLGRVQTQPNCRTGGSHDRKPANRCVDVFRRPRPDTRRPTHSPRCTSQESAQSSVAYPIPQSPEETVSQAFKASKKAWQDGISKQKVELLLPLIGATDLDDWPGGIRQQFKAAAPMVEELLRNLKMNEGLYGRLEAEIIEQGDACASWSSPNLTAILFPTAEAIQKVQPKFEGRSLGLLINPQWMGGQVISDFGFGNKKKNAEKFLEPFQWTYSLKQYRVQGYDLRVLRCYPGDWQVHIASEDGTIECVAKEPEAPSYKRLEEIVRENGGTDGWLARIEKELKFNADSMKSPE